MRKPEITLIGAGLAGSLLAVYLARRGYRVRLFERRPDLRKVEISAGRSINLALANRGIHALREVGLMPKIEPVLIPMKGRMLHDERGNLQLLPYGNKPHEVIYSVSRGGLTALLMDAAEEAGDMKILFDRHCRDFDLPGQRFRAGDEQASFEILIGTDGGGSEVRDAVMRATHGKASEEMLAHSYKELTMPADRARGMERNALHIWPRGEFMLIALPNPDGSFTATLFLPNTIFDELNDPHRLMEFFKEEFPDSMKLLPDLGEQFFANPAGRLGTVRCWPWHYEGQALLLGDAAHAIVPFHGQGMNAAFEDCSALNALLDDGSDWSNVFDNFARERKPNTDAIADMALENYIEMRSSVRDPRFQLKKELSFMLEERHPGRFLPRYSMVMFHSIPYAAAQSRGAIQEDILNTLIGDATRAENIDLALARRLIDSRLPPIK